jgi:hypothetical protein
LPRLHDAVRDSDRGVPGERCRLYEHFAQLVCVENTLPIPTYVQKQLGNATDLSGPITVSWDTYTATGSYSGTDARGSLTIHSTG